MMAGCRYLPQIGLCTIIMNDYPKLKYALIGAIITQASRAARNDIIACMIPVLSLCCA